MKKILSLIIAISISAGVFSQTLSPEVNASAGDYYTNANGSLSVTIGETVIETFTGANSILTQGFQQPFLAPVSNPALMCKVYLQGPYQSGGIMNTALSVSDSFPTAQPYNISPWNYPGTETIGSIPANVVDWVLVEARDAGDVTSILDRRAGILLDNGNVVDTDFSSPLLFNNILDGDYYIVIQHHNHFPVMTGIAITLPNVILHDFTDIVSFPPYGGSDALIVVETGIGAMIAGDVNDDGQLKYSGPGNDRGLILQRIINVSSSSNITTTISGYYSEDVNLNSMVKYSGPANDPSLIIQNLVNLTGSTNITSVFNTVVPNSVTAPTKKAPRTGPIDILLRENNEYVEVVISTRSLIQNGIIDNIQFTLAWDKSIKEIDKILSHFESDFFLLPQEKIASSDNNFYQTFAMAVIKVLPSQFVPGEEIVILRFPSNDITNNLNIADNNHTLKYNGDYYISLYGVDKTGMIKTIEESAAHANYIRFYPNPVIDGNMNLEILSEVSEKVTVRIYDLCSRIVYYEDMSLEKNKTYTRTLNLDYLSDGAYFLSIKGKNTNFIDKLVVY
ncbi:MAG: T9SS type A sorting domain-containing protein [Bacteroidales bacterium]|nr:T9SS type A sorting domain-containing protein [Bacteroidales bacterium]